MTKFQKRLKHISLIQDYNDSDLMYRLADQKADMRVTDAMHRSYMHHIALTLQTDVEQIFVLMQTKG
jgi:hypothetical protein